MVTPDPWGPRAALGLLDLRDWQVTWDLMARRDLMALMVYQAFQVYKDPRDPPVSQAAMGQTETMDIQACLELLASTGIRVCRDCVDRRATLWSLWV